MCIYKSIKLRKKPKFLYKVVKNQSDKFSSLFDNISIPTEYIIGKEIKANRDYIDSGIHGFTQFKKAKEYKNKLASYSLDFGTINKTTSLAILKCKFLGIIDYGIGDEQVCCCLVVNSVIPIKVMVQDKL